MNKINLFTTYTNEETKFLLEIIKKDFSRSRHSIFSGVNVDELGHFYKRKFPKKDIIADFEFIVVERGKVGVIKDKKITKILNKDECFGVLKHFFNEEYTLIVLEDSEVTFFGIGENTLMYKNIMHYTAKHLKEKIII